MLSNHVNVIESYSLYATSRLLSLLFLSESRSHHSYRIGLLLLADHYFAHIKNGIQPIVIDSPLLTQSGNVVFFI
jgi:hypothetical protein